MGALGIPASSRWISGWVLNSNSKGLKIQPWQKAANMALCHALLGCTKGKMDGLVSKKNPDGTIPRKIPMERPIKPLYKLVLWVRHPKDSKPPTPPNHA